MDVSANEISEVSDKISQLNSLVLINVSHNAVKAIPASMGELTNLTVRAGITCRLMVMMAFPSRCCSCSITS